LLLHNLLPLGLNYVKEDTPCGRRRATPSPLAGLHYPPIGTVRSAVEERSFELEDIQPQLMMVSKASSYYVFCFKLSMCDIYVFVKLPHDTFTFFTNDVLFSMLQMLG
jgi:hypothetical protein